MEKKCENCRFWIHKIRASSLGECHGAPPTARESMQLAGIWPKTKSDDWCGVFDAKEDNQLEEDK